MEGDGGRRSVDGVPRDKTNNVTRMLKSQRRSIEGCRADNDDVMEEVVGKIGTFGKSNATKDSDDSGSDLHAEENSSDKGTPMYQNVSRFDKSKIPVNSGEGVRGRGSGRLTVNRRRVLRSAHDVFDSEEASDSETEKEERRRVAGNDGSGSLPPNRSKEGQQPRLSQRRRRGSYSSSEDGVVHRRGDTERQGFRRHSGGGDSKYAPEHGECSTYRRRPVSGSSNSEYGYQKSYDREGRRRHTSSDDDFERERSRRALALSIRSSTQIDENEKRRERRQKQRDREAKRTQRKNQGLKGHYIAVDEHGEPYGYGKGAWKQELTRLCRSLDPSVMDIRWQPEADMKLLRKRLKDNFEYSAPISKAYIRSLAGRNVTQRRNKIINSMVDDAPCPSGMDAHVWRRLDRIRQNPRREELSQRMRYANSCRSNVGRTGPKGVSGVRDDLREKLGREPDPEELEEELRRDKGYGGRSKKKKIGNSLHQNQTWKTIPSKKQKRKGVVKQQEGRCCCPKKEM